jgi:hypothetical protein
LAAVVWAVAAVLTAGHGLDITDEGYYLLSYRWWNTNLYTYTGAQYFYGPVFQLLGYDIAGLRLFRLLTVIVAHTVFGWAFLRWLRGHRPSATPSIWWEVAGTAAIVASGGMVYGWLPLSPGYNDISLLGALLAAAVVLRVAREAERGRPVPLWVPASLGPLAVVMLLAKWPSSALSLTVVGIVLLVVVWPRGRRERLRATGAAAGATLVTIAVVHVFVVPLTDALPPMMAVNRAVAADTNSPTDLLQMYAVKAELLLKQVVRTHLVLLLAATVVPLLKGRRLRWLAFGILAVGVADSARRVILGHGVRGGTVNLTRFPIVITAGLLAIVLAAGAVVVAERVAARSRPDVVATLSPLVRRDVRGWVVLAMLSVLPLTQAAGTGNALHYLAIGGLGAWMAVVIAVVTGTDARATARVLTATVATGIVVCATLISTDALWNHPYRTAGHAQTTTTVPGVAALSSVRLDPASASEYGALYDMLRPYIEPPGRAIMAFDRMPGLVLLLNGRPVGEAWYSATDPQRTAAGIRQACATAQPWWGDRAPILLFNRPVTKTETAALESCGLTFATDYRLLAPIDQTHGLQVYVPINSTDGHA